MTKILIISDTHGNLENLEKIDKIMEECDLIFHLGDGVKDIARGKYEDKVKFVYGNCDYGDKDYVIVQVEEVKILLTHGHNHSVKDSLTSLMFFAEEKDVDMVCYGHTHISNMEKVGKITYLNPGSMKDNFYGASYAYAVVLKNKVVASIVDLK